MSNQLVGSIYQRIIADVIESSRVDFEEGGVDPSTLDELKQVWQRKLSSLQVAQFPWDPTPAATQVANPPAVPSNAPGARVPPQPTPSASTPASSVPSTANNGAVKVKAEPDSDAGVAAPAPHAHPVNPALNNPQAAAQRAANLMQQKFGSQANNSIGAMQSGLGAAGARPPNAQAPLSHPANSQQQNPPQQSQNGVGNAQTDGSGDTDGQWIAVMSRRRDDAIDELGTIEADAIIRRHVEAMGQRMEGGGLMLPLRERASPVKGKARKAVATLLTDCPLPVISAHSNASTTATQPAMPQYDGGDEFDSDDKDGIKDEDVDEDAINSDLDDPDDNVQDDQDDDESMTQIMLCMYDKVQRVKNKWKCTLKDGVLTVNGKEYVFHKATGEFEW